MEDASGLRSSDRLEDYTRKHNGRLPEGKLNDHDDEVDEVIAKHNELMNQRKQQNEKGKK